jgi:hypothetical protein
MADHIPPNPYIITNRNDGTRLRELLDKEGISITEFADQYLGKSRPVAYALLRKPEFSRDEMALICYLFNLEPEFFGDKSHSLRTAFNTGINPRIFNTVASFIALTIFEEQSQHHRDFIKRYFTEIGKRLCEAKESIQVCHYLGKRYEHFPDYVRERYTPFYLQMEAHLTDTADVRYQRFAVLPIQLSKETTDPALILGTALELMLPETIEHVARCWVLLKERFAFYVIQTPMRLHSFSVVDNRYSISEYDKIDIKQRAAHDLVFIDQVNEMDSNDPIRSLLKVYKHDFEVMSKEKDNKLLGKLGLDDIMEALLSSIKRLYKEEHKAQALVEETSNALRQPKLNLEQVDADTTLFARLQERKREVAHLQARIAEHKRKLEIVETHWQNTL